MARDSARGAGLPVTPMSVGGYRPSFLPAFLMSIVFPGLGHVYVGAARRGLLIMAVALIGNAVYRFLVARSFRLLVAVVVVGGLLWLFTQYDLIRLYRHLPSRPRGRLQRWPVYLALIFGFVASGVAFEFGARATKGAPAPYRVVSGSMIPTLRFDEHFLVMQRDDARQWLRRGDVIVFRALLGADYVKRVVGMPGDRITFHGGLPQIDRAPLFYARAEGRDVCLLHSTAFFAVLPNNRSYLTCSRPMPEWEGRVFTVPSGRVFVLGDNLAHSVDSRFQEVGFVAFEDIKARVQYVHWSSDTDRIGLRLD